MVIALLVTGALIISALAFYAGRLLFLLSQQNARQALARKKRVVTITESIDTIAKAMTQQQCELSEGAIRICNLLEALPIDPKPEYPKSFPNIFTLFDRISIFATLDARKALSKKQRREQDKEREEIEAQFESAVLEELPSITQFCASLNS